MNVTPVQALSRATSALVSDHELTDVLGELLSDACAALDAASAGVLVVTPDQGLDVLAATSHAARELELYQAQQERGPCVAAIEAGTSVAAAGASLRRRWPDLGRLMTEAGYGAVRAHPLHWQEQTLGAVNFFHRGDAPQPEEDRLVAQAFADIATLVMVMPSEVSAEHLAERTRAALDARTAIEQAKGVLMYQQDVDAGEAFERLRGRARRHHATLTRTAREIIDDATRR
jgi:hypothetical protein